MVIVTAPYSKAVEELSILIANISIYCIRSPPADNSILEFMRRCPKGGVTLVLDMGRLLERALGISEI